jgi:UPF0755 protein
MCNWYHVRLGILSLFFLGSCTSLSVYLDGSKKTINTDDVRLFIPSNSSLDNLSKILTNEGVINDVSAFIAVGEYKKLGVENIAAGYYEIAPGIDYKTLLNGFTMNRLGNGNAEKEVKVTFNNCRDIYQLAGKVSRHIEVDSLALVSYILSDSILNKYGFTKERIGALFLPDTYHMYWDTDEVAFVNRMAVEFKKFWTEERKSRLAIVGLKSQSDAVTLASIVYKEQDKHKPEWKTIAGLYLNRIRAGWPLQSDPTFRFCWGDKLEGVQRLLKHHREIDCPYNTYIYAGLPPGPIHIPPAGVVDAVLYPEEHQYMFMMAKVGGDGWHAFAKTLSEHNRNAAAYHKWLDSLGL